MTVKSRIEIALLLPALPDARDACVQRLSDLLKATDEAAIRAAVLGYGHRQYAKGVQIATLEANTKIDRLKLDAGALLAAQVAKTHAAEQSLQDFINRQEKQDALYKKTVSDLSDRLRLAAGSTGRLRDPNAAPGCRLGSGSAPGKSSTASRSGTDDGAETGGLFSAGATELFERITREADEVNAAYASCRPYALKVSEPSKE